MLKLGKDGFLYCGCKGKRSLREAGVEGTAAETQFLRANGFCFTGDCRGDKYYMGSLNRLIWLYADGSWSASPRPGKNMTFEDYVKASTLEDFLAG